MYPIRFAPLVFVLISLCPNPAVAQSDLSFEPYTVYVVEAKSHARCGPSDEYYRTDPLRRGQALEVYAETDDGWLGIRPPEESFCWVQADSIDLNDTTDIGTVIEDRTVAWIGTHLGRARSYRWQVQMASGEDVTVIGKSEREGADGPKLWYRVVPPSGEYRWVHRDQVVDSSEKLVEATQQAERQTTLGDRFVEGSNIETAEKRDVSAGESRRRKDRRVTSALTVVEGRSVLEPAPTANSTAANATAVNPASVPADPWDSNDNRLGVDDVAPVGEQAITTQSPPVEPEFKTASPAEIEFIGRPKLIEIGSRPSAPAQSVAAVDGNWVTGTSPRAVARTNDPVASATLTNPIVQVSGQSADESSVVGTLVQVYSSRSNSPPFALTDNTGRTVAYVTPIPGTNLRPHLNSEVRVSGSQGYLTGLNTPHIVATTVSRTAE